jgi:hypothetical protein
LDVDAPPPPYAHLSSREESVEHEQHIDEIGRPPEYLDCVPGGVFEWTVEDVCTFVHRTETLRPLEDVVFRGHLIDGPRFVALDAAELARCGVTDAAICAVVRASISSAVVTYTSDTDAPGREPSPVHVCRIDSALISGVRVGVLREIVLQRVAVSPAELRLLVGACSSAHGSAVRWLSLKGVGLCRAHTADLADLIVRVPTLRALDLGGNSIDDGCARVLCAALSSSRTLRELSLDHNELGPPSGTHIARTLRRNRSLRSLSLYWNALGPVGGRTVLMAARRHRGIQLLDLSSVGLGRGVAVAAAGAVRHASGLQTLRLADNGLGPEVGMAIAEALPHNRGLRNLDLGDNRLGTTSVDLLRAWGSDDRRGGVLRL